MNIPRCEQITYAAHISARHCDGCAIVFLLYSAIVYNVQCLIRARMSRSKRKSRGDVEGMAGKPKAIDIVYLCQRCMQLIVSDLPMNLTYEYSPRVELIR